MADTATATTATKKARSRPSRKERKLAKKETWKAMTPAQRWKKRGVKLLVVLGVIVALAATVAIALNVSYAIKPAIVSEPHAGMAQREMAYPASPRENLEVLRDGEQLYVTTTGTGWSQTAEDFSSQRIAWGSEYNGTDPFKTMGAYCANCHNKEELGLWRGTAEEAHAKVMSMVDNYGCTQLTQVQIDALIAFYTE